MDRVWGVRFVVLASAVSLGSRGVVDSIAAAATKPAAGKTCKVAQIGTVSGSLICTKSGKSAVWKKTVALPTTTVLDPATAPAGTVLFRENFDGPAPSPWKNTGGDGWTAQLQDGQFRLAAAPPPLRGACGRAST